MPLTMQNRQIDYLVSKFYDANCYIIKSIEGLIVIDPSFDCHYIENKFEMPVKYVLITHAHYDHIEKIDSYLNKSIKFYMHRHAVEKIANPIHNLSTLFNKNYSVDLSNEDVNIVHNSSVISLGDDKIKVLETTGHSNCSLSFILGDAIFTGDTLFYLSIGRTDLYSANSADMLKSLRLLSSFDENYQVYPGHGASTTIAFEKQHNKYL